MQTGKLSVSIMFWKGINKMEDYMVRATAAGGQIRAFAARTTNMAEKARKLHNTSPVITAALGRLLSAGAMMGSMMKGEDDVLTIRINGDGPVNMLIVTADSKGNVKGYPGNPHVELPPNSKGKLDVAGAVGKGFLTVIKDIGLKEPYSGTCELVTGEIGDDLTYYFASSEQTPSSVGLGVLVDRDLSVKEAGGFIIQVMPDATEETISEIEKNLSQITSVTALLEEGLTPEQILDKILGSTGLEVLDRMSTGFYCNCSREKVSSALALLDRKEIDEIIAEGKPIEVKCDFCNTVYNFDISELSNLTPNT